MSMTSRYVWVNGELVDHDQAHVHFLAAALHHGIAVFEGLRGYATTRGPAVFRLEDHADRLIDSAHAIGFRDLPITPADLRQAIKRTAHASGFADCYIRPVISLAANTWTPSLDGGRIHTGIAVWRAEPLAGPGTRTHGVRVNVSSFTRHQPSSAIAKTGVSGPHVNRVLARTEALRLGFDEAILLDADGHVAECTSERVFLVRQGTLFAPPAVPIAEDVTRDTVLTLARGRRIVVVEAPVSRDQLYVADEIFFAGAGAELTPVYEVDGRPVGHGSTGSVTRELQAALRSVIHGAHPLSSAWLTPVDPEPLPDVPPVHERHEVVEVGYGHGV